MSEKKKAFQKRSRSQILADLEDLIASPGYMHVIAELSSEDFFIDTRDVANIAWRDRLHVNELALLVGIILKSREINFEEIDAQQMKTSMQKTRELLDELHRTFIYDLGKVADSRNTSDASTPKKEKKERIRELFGGRDSIVEATFYGDTGFYDVQCFELAPKLYANDLTWLKENTPYDLKNGKTIYLALEDLMNALHHVRSHENEFIRKEAIESEGPMRAMDEMAFPLSLIVKSVRRRDERISSKEVKDFLELFSCTPGEQNSFFKEPGDENIFSYKPIVKLGDDIYFVPNKTLLASAFYKSPLYWMRGDEKYAATANKHIGNITEDITYDYFVNIFGKENVYKDIDVYRGKNRVTDIDVMGVLGNTVVIAQNKSKKMTLEALSGDVDAIKNDFQKAVIEPYEQGIKVRDVILGDQPYKLKDRSGKSVYLPQGIEHSYILCVSNEPYPAIMSQMRALLEKVDQLPPMQISLFDLDLMAEYLTDPFDFTFYVKQRLELDEKIIAENEIILLALYVKHGLRIPSGASILAPDQAFGQLIDADYYHRKKGTPKPKKKDSLSNEWVNADYQAILNQAKQLDDPKKTDIVFFLMSLSPDIIDVLTKYIGMMNQQAGRDGEAHNFTIPISYDGESWGGVTYVIGRDLHGTTARLQTISSMNKYRSRADQWLALGAGIDGVLGLIAFNNKPWVQTRDMDEALALYIKNTNGRKIDIRK